MRAKRHEIRKRGWLCLDVGCAEKVGRQALNCILARGVENVYRFFCAQVRRRYGNGQNDSGAFRIPECDLLVSRIRQRVASGGHAVPDQDVRRRRERSLQNLKGYADVMDKIRVFDTSEASPVLVYEKNGAALVYDAARFARIQKDLCL